MPGQYSEKRILQIEIPDKWAYRQLVPCISVKLQNKCASMNWYKRGSLLITNSPWECSGGWNFLRLFVLRYFDMPGRHACIYLSHCEVKFKSNLVQLSILCSYFTINHFFICKNFIYKKFWKTCNSLIEKKYCIKVLQNKTTTIEYNINLLISIHGKYVYRLCIKNTEQYSSTNEMSLTNLINIHFRISIA